MFRLSGKRLAHFGNLRSVADAIERESPGLIGKTVADIPEIAAVRLKYRRRFYHWAETHFAMAVFNLTIALASAPLWWISTFGAAIAVWGMIGCEQRARTMTRQLKRPAAEQVARDLCGLSD